MLKIIRAWWAQRNCAHEWDSRMTNMGMGKMFTCRKCAKTAFI